MQAIVCENTEYEIWDPKWNMGNGLRMKKNNTLLPISKVLIMLFTHSMMYGLLHMDEELNDFMTKFGFHFLPTF